MKLLLNVSRIIVVKSFFVIASSQANENRPAGNDELSRLIPSQKDSNITRNISIVKSAYYVFVYTDRQLHDIKQFCCRKDDSVPLAIDTTFNSCDLRLTDTSYRNERLLNESTGTSPVFLGPCMFHFTKDEEAFNRFASEVRIGNSGLADLKILGVDMESAIYNGFKYHNQELPRLVCVSHLKKRDEEKMLKLLQKTNQSSAQKSPSKAEVLNDIYGERTGTHYEYGLAVVQYGRFQC